MKWKPSPSWPIALLAALSLATAARVAWSADAPAAPPIARQFAREKIIPGSALAHLIKNNQEFHLLAVEEPRGKIDVPDWLKVYYRKQHPNMKVRPKDPTQGYPMALENVYRWMITHQDLQPAPAPQPGQPMATLSVGSNRRISGSQVAPRSESDIRVNFNNLDLIIAASNSIEASGHQAQFYSTDGGTTWGQTSLPFVGSDQFHSDPTVDWTSDGTAWVTTMGIEGTIMRMRAYKSVDQGRTWTFDAIFSASQTEVDKQMMWVDHSPTSSFRDNIYVIWHNGPVAFVNRRTGPAGSWQTPIQVSGAETTGTPIGADITTNNKGDVFGFWPDTNSQKIYLIKSTNGGKSFSPPRAIASTFGSFQVAVPAFAERQALIGVSAAAYSAASKDMVYAAWMDLSGEDNCKSPDDQPGTDASSSCKTRIWFARSADGGTTWQTKKVNDRTTRSDQFNQRLAVDMSNGTLVLIYYDTEGDAQRKKVNVWYQISTDDGQTWSQAQKVTTTPSDETTGGADSGNQFGDYNGLSGYGGKFFPTWTDRRSGGPEEIWTAPIFAGTLNPASAPPPVRRAMQNAVATDENFNVKWAHVIPTGMQDHPEGKAVIYQVMGRDTRGHPCQMLVDRNLGRVIEFKRTLPFAEEKEKLPAEVKQALEKYREKNKTFEPRAVDVIYLGRKIAAYTFRAMEKGVAREAIIRVNGELVPTD